MFIVFRATSNSVGHPQNSPLHPVSQVHRWFLQTPWPEQFLQSCSFTAQPAPNHRNSHLQMPSRQAPCPTWHAGGVVAWKETTVIDGELQVGRLAALDQSTCFQEQVGGYRPEQFCGHSCGSFFSSQNLPTQPSWQSHLYPRHVPWLLQFRHISLEKARGVHERWSKLSPAALPSGTRVDLANAT